VIAINTHQKIVQNLPALNYLEDSTTPPPGILFHALILAEHKSVAYSFPYFLPYLRPNEEIYVSFNRV